MSIELVMRLRRATRTAYSDHPVARLSRAWRQFAGNPRAADMLLLPLTGLVLALLVIAAVPDAGAIIASAFSGIASP
ncbi:MAG TPA: hypothetical protein VK432_04970 [Stellaceae bacterium]|nr:hypothetical protein [Stellaceae bacterium]